MACHEVSNLAGSREELGGFELQARVAGAGLVAPSATRCPLPIGSRGREPDFLSPTPSRSGCSLLA